MNITILGAGTWGIALGRLLYRNGYDILIWSSIKEEVENLSKTHMHKNLPYVMLAPDIKFTNDMEEALSNTKIVVIAVPSIFVRSVSEEMVKYIKDGSIVVIVSKGIEKDTLYTMSEVVEDVVKNKKDIKVVALSGPTHAEEVIKDIPSAIVSASKNVEARNQVQDIFMNENFRVYTNDDIKGVELSAAIKNIFALACGISDGLGYGDNTKAAIITRGLAELVRLGEALNCDRNTFYGLAGIGDLVVTATSRHSRNNTCGRYIGEGLSVDEAVKKVGMVVEGINAIPASIEMRDKYKIDMPICSIMNEIVFNNIKPIDAINILMNREKKKE